MKAKSFYKNNKHNNMNPKEKENNQEEELKTQATPNECDEETVGQETSQENEAPLTEEEKARPGNWKRPMNRLKSRRTNTCACLPSLTITANAP